MENLSPEKLIESLEWRYATKKFNQVKKIDEKTWGCLEQALILSPSSYGLQPWKFIIVQNPELKEKLKTATLDEEREIEEEIYSLESRKEQMLAFVNQNVEDIDEDF